MVETAHDPMLTGHPEVTNIRERLVIAPATGRFMPLPPETFTTEGEWAHEGQTLGYIRNGKNVVPVVSAFSGWVMGMLAAEGQPVKAGETLLWIRT